jgi:probable rRNA maturation factor
MNHQTDSLPGLVSFAFSNLHPRLSFSESKVKTFFQELFTLYPQGPVGELSIVFMERAEHNQLHGEFLQDFRPTDVITFPSDPDENMAGEFCISVDQAWEESVSRKIPFVEELSLYLIHGWLHLVGFDDIEKVERKQMRFEEERSLKHIEKMKAWPDFILAPIDS